MQLTDADIDFILHAYDVRKDATLNNDPNISILPYSEYTDAYRLPIEKAIKRLEISNYRVSFIDRDDAKVLSTMLIEYNRLLLSNYSDDMYLTTIRFEKRAVLRILDKLEHLPQPIYIRDRNDSITGVVRNLNAGRCRMEGCTGVRMYVIWEDGKSSRPCSKGCSWDDEFHCHID